MGCRSYDAQVGRFITRDTYLDQKPYAYCDGDPVNATDPGGHMGIGSKIPFQPPTDREIGDLDHLAEGIAGVGVILLPICPIGSAIIAVAVGVIGIFATLEYFQKDIYDDTHNNKKKD